jgi:transcriptional regulator with XRE-family HTH domain
MSTIFKRMWQAFRDKEYRDIYTEGFSNSKIATQIKVLREQRGWTQQQLAEAAGMKQSRIATLEDVNYSSWSIRTLRRLAETFDLWLDVEFKEFGAVWPQLQDFNRESLTRHSFADDPAFKEGAVERVQTIQDKGVTSAISAIIPPQEQPSASALTSGLTCGIGYQGFYGQLTPAAPPISATLGIHFANNLDPRPLHTGELYETQPSHRAAGALAATA